MWRCVLPSQQCSVDEYEDLDLLEDDEIVLKSCVLSATSFVG